VYLKYGLAVILTFVGIKMVIVDFYHVPVSASLAVIVVTLMVTIVASLKWGPKEVVAKKWGPKEDVAKHGT
jgi:tellurite resistance protein TerC